MLRVIVERSRDVVSDATFRKTLVSVGRDASNDVVLDDDQISSIHPAVTQKRRPSGRLSHSEFVFDYAGFALT